MKNKIICLVLLCIITLSGCSNKAKDNSADKAAQMLGTVVTAKAYGDNAKEALNLAFDRVKQIENLMSRNINTSEVSLINQSAGKQSTIVSPDTFFVLDTSLKYAEKTNGAFNPLVGKIVDLWGIGTEHAKIPTNEELDKLISYLDYNQLKLNKNNLEVKLDSNNVTLDLGAIAKGYAADEMKKILINQGITSCMLNLGGNVLVIGSKPDGELWTVGIQHPLEEERGSLAATIKLQNTSIVTSGNYERYFDHNGKRYHHIIDPSTGYPAESGIISSSIIADNSIDADALSTSVYILGKDKGLELIESLPNVEAIIITDDMHVYTTSGINPDNFKIYSEDFIYEKN